MIDLTKDIVKDMFDGEEFEYFVCLIDPETNENIHFVGYETRPNVISLNHLFEELKTDEDFGMPANYVDSLLVRIFKFK